MEIEKLIKLDESLLEPNAGYKKNQFTGNLCHII